MMTFHLNHMTNYLLPGGMSFPLFFPPLGGGGGTSTTSGEGEAPPPPLVMTAQ